MTKDELKNRISLALKDPMLQQGFEIICKEIAELKEVNADLKQSLDWANERESEDVNRIAELEKENAKLKKEVEKHKWNNIFLEDCAVYDKKITEEYTTLQERISELEKEKAELDNFIMQSKKDGISPINALIIKNLGNQLTKAKKIVGNLYAICKDNHYPNSSVLMEQAVQFLKESEND